ncbi:20409_t:CDS:2, partial [Dentiscutata erythropus]
MNSQLSYHFNLLISAVINFLISINNIYFQHSHSTSFTNLLDIDIEQPPNYTLRYESINDFLEKNRNINKYEFFLKANDIDRVNTKHQYVYGLNDINNIEHECLGVVDNDKFVTLFKNEQDVQNFSIK